MRIASTICLLLAGALGLFSYWGINTRAGQHAYDEMAGIIPWSAGLLAAILAVAAILLWWFGRRSGRG